MHDINVDAVAHPLAKYRNHLEFHGYHVEEDDDLLICHHARKADLVVQGFSERGVLIILSYSFNPRIKRIDCLEYVNKLNAEFLFMKAYLDEDCLMMQTFCEGEYNKTNFSILLDNLEYDITVIDQNELTEKYLQ